MALPINIVQGLAGLVTADIEREPATFFAAQLSLSMAHFITEMGQIIIGGEGG